MSKLYDKLCELEYQLRIMQKDSLDAEECCQYLRITKSYLRHLTAERKIPHYKCMGRLYFSKKELNDWRLQHRQPTTDEMAATAAMKY